jgi:hypothetical protein
MREQDDTRELLETFRAYRRSTLRLREVFQGTTDGLALTFKLSAAAGETTASFVGGDRIHRHAALLRPFMKPGSPIELRGVWTRIRAAGLVTATAEASVEEAFVRADRLSMALAVNDRVMTARDIYDVYGEGQYFGE